MKARHLVFALTGVEAKTAQLWMCQKGEASGFFFLQMDNSGSKLATKKQKLFLWWRKTKRKNNLKLKLTFSRFEAVIFSQTMVNLTTWLLNASKWVFFSLSLKWKTRKSFQRKKKWRMNGTKRERWKKDCSYRKRKVELRQFSFWICLFFSHRSIFPFVFLWLTWSQLKAAKEKKEQNLCQKHDIILKISWNTDTISS